jgi:hypothetical protein
MSSRNRQTLVVAIRLDAAIFLDVKAFLELGPVDFEFRENDWTEISFK